MSCLFVTVVSFGRVLRGTAERRISIEQTLRQCDPTAARDCQDTNNHALRKLEGAWTVRRNVGLCGSSDESIDWSAVLKPPNGHVDRYAASSSQRFRRSVRTTLVVKLPSWIGRQAGQLGDLHASSHGVIRCRRGTTRSAPWHRDSSRRRPAAGPHLGRGVVFAQHLTPCAHAHRDKQAHFG